MTAQPKVILSAEDRTAAAFASAQRGLEKMGLSADAATKYLGGLAAAFSVGAIVASVRNVANFADEQGKLAQRAGETAAEFSRLSYAARQADVDNSELAKGLRQLGADAADGGKKMADLGISVRDNDGKLKTNAQLFRELADVIAGTEDPQKRATLAAQVLGDKLGPQLVPLLAQGSGGLKDLADEADRFGRVVDDKAVKAAEAFNDNMTKLSEAGAGLAQKLAGPVIESLANTSSYFIKVANDVGLARASLITFGAAVARTLGVDEVGKLQSQAKANQNAVALTVKQIETFQRFADRGDAAAASRVASLRDQFARLQADGQRISSALTGKAVSIEDDFKPISGSPLPDLGTPDSRKAVKGLTAAQQAQKDYDDFVRKTEEDRGAYLGRRAEQQMREQAEIEKRYLQDVADFEEATGEYVWKRNLKRLEDEEKAREDLAKKAADAQAAQVERLGDAYSTTLRRAFDEGMKVGDLLKRLAFDAINIQFLTPAAQAAGNWLGSAVSGLLQSYDGGGYTGAGSRSGGMDGRGGFLAMLHPNETVLDHTRGQAMGGAGGGVTIVQHMNFGNADAATVAQLRAEGDRIKAETLAAVPAAVLQARRTSTGFANAMRGA